MSDHARLPVRPRPRSKRFAPQVLSGILPISRVSAVPLCIYHAAQLLPLERILGLAHPAAEAAGASVDDKRTWRAPRTAEQRQHDEARKTLVWTAMDVLTAFALKKGWVTAKAGRPDVNRAGNYGAWALFYYFPAAVGLLLQKLC